MPSPKKPSRKPVKLPPSWDLTEPLLSAKKKVRVLGLDTGFASVGWSVVEMAATDAVETSLKPIAMGCFTTQPSAKKLKLKVADDDFKRSVDTAHFLRALVTKYKVKVFCSEAMSLGFKNATTGIKMGRCYGMLSALVAFTGLPFLQATPTEIKFAVTGKKTASKEEVEASLNEMFDSVPEALLADVAKGKREHPYDSFGAVVACWDSDTMKMARQL